MGCLLPSNLAKRLDYSDEPEVVSIDLIVRTPLSHDAGL